MLRAIRGLTRTRRPIADLGPHRDGVRFARKADVQRAFSAGPPIDFGRFRDDLDTVADPDYNDPYER
jgi:hypothetical protein